MGAASAGLGDFADAAGLLEISGVVGLVQYTDPADLAKKFHTGSLVEQRYIGICFVCARGRIGEYDIAFQGEVHSDFVEAHILLVIESGHLRSPQSSSLSHHHCRCSRTGCAGLSRHFDTQFAMTSDTDLAERQKTDSWEKSCAGSEASFHDCFLEESGIGSV